MSARCTGRSKRLALRFALEVLEKPGTPVEIRDHLILVDKGVVGAPTVDQNHQLAREVVKLLGSMGLGRHVERVRKPSGSYVIFNSKGSEE